MSREFLRVGGILAILGGAAVAVVLAGIALNEVFFHGFSPTCSDGHPEWTAELCGPTPAAGLPYLTGIAVTLLAVAGVGWVLVRLDRPPSRVTRPSCRA